MDVIAPIPEEMQHNLFVMEVCNSWEYITKLMKDHKEGNIEKRKLDGLDQYWLNSLLQNNLYLDQFTDEEDFYKKLIR
jgi:hypothetical protein